MILKRLWLPVLVVFALGATSAVAEETATGIEEGGEETEQEKTVCELIDEAATEHKLPVEFFTRLIWKESRFRPNAISPKGAQGIAQFMPATAARRGLADPFDPASAIAASAHYLRELSVLFGNLGLAAAAYNAGEERVSGWMAGSRRLPAETRDYVLFITGRPAADWKDPEITGAIANDAAEDESQTTDCAKVAALLSKPGAGTALVSLRRKSADWAPWGVQVAGNFSAARALARYETLQEKHDGLLGGREPLVLSAVVRSRGTAPFYHVRVPAETREEATRLCTSLRRSGGACVVLKNPN